MSYHSFRVLEESAVILYAGATTKIQCLFEGRVTVIVSHLLI
jgi:hypothetical protein